tara:strand:- start:208 stop:414 length:207 start_codon:yes stop_codon:yes gene_type:complete
MGFHKRRLNEETVIERFKKDGVKGILNYIGKADALFTNSEKVGKILDVLDCEDCETKKDLEIKKIIDK